MVSWLLLLILVGIASVLGCAALTMRLSRRKQQRGFNVITDEQRPVTMHPLEERWSP